MKLILAAKTWNIKHSHILGQSLVRCQCQIFTYLFQCSNCYVHDLVYQVAMPFVFQIPAILISGTLYCRTLKTLKNVRSVHRSSWITKIFIALWLLWVITSVPYKTFVALESLRIVKSSDNAIDTSFYGVMSIMNLNDVFSIYDFVPIYYEDCYTHTQ